MTPSIDNRKCYAVIGNPTAHSRSPFIHEHFGRQTGIALRYGKINAPMDQFPAHALRFFSEGGGGLNVTVPFKEQACVLAAAGLSERAQLAGAVNTLWMKDGLLHGCNTDGLGLLDDLTRCGVTLTEKRILLVGAGGAAKGVIAPLLLAGCQRLHIVNRGPQRALDLLSLLSGQKPEFANRLSAGGLDQADGSWDIVINATSSSLGRHPPSLPPHVYAGALAYDLMYSAQPTPFMHQALAYGAQATSDGLGMLVAQAAASFALWHGVQPETEPVLAALRQQLIDDA